MSNWSWKHYLVVVAGVVVAGTPQLIAALPPEWQHAGSALGGLLAAILGIYTEPPAKGTS